MPQTGKKCAVEKKKKHASDWKKDATDWKKVLCGPKKKCMKKKKKKKQRSFYLGLTLVSEPISRK